MLRIASPFYDASRAVTVVMIDDAYLRRIGSGWPMTYREQGLLLRRLLNYEPAALFIDLLYTHRHGRGADDDSQDLLAPLPGATDQSIPVLFAALSVERLSVPAVPGALGGSRPFCIKELPASGLYADRIADPLSIETSLRAPFGIASGIPAEPFGSLWLPGPVEANAPTSIGPRLGVVPVSWSGCGGSYPLLLGASRFGATPAMALFDAACRRRPRLPACDFGGKAPLEVAERFVAPMTVRWGAWAPSAQAPFYTAEACQRMTDARGRVPVWTRVMHALQQLALGALFDLRDAASPQLALPCPAVPVIRADAILDGDEAALATLLHDRVVLVGAQVSGIPDWQTSAVHGRVPGVIFHAMALDNLLVRGAHYLRPLPGAWSRGVMLVLACAAALFAPRVVGRKPVLPQEARAWIGLVLWMLYAIVLVVHGHLLQAVAVLGVALAFDLVKPTETFRYALLFVLMAALAMLAVALGRTPWNWIGLAFVVLATTETLKTYIKVGPQKRFPHEGSLCAQALRKWRVRSGPHGTDTPDEIRRMP